MGRRYQVQHRDAEFTADTEADGVVVVDGARCTVAPWGPSRYRVTMPDGRAVVVAVAGRAPGVWAASEGQTYEFSLDASARGKSGTRHSAGEMTPPMPATVVKVVVAAGARIATGDAVVVLEAMKMELTIRASRAGIVRAVRCAVGDLVRPGTVLVEIDE